MIKVTDPQVGETIYDGAVGSAGFLCGSYDYMRRDDLSASDYETLQKRTFYGLEKKSLAYIIGIMNMVLHGIEAPNIVHTNSLNENVMNIQEKDRHDVILANPPFGGGERREVQQNFPIRTGETAYLFLQHFIRKLRAGGRAAVVIKSTFLSNTDNASVALRKELLDTCTLHTILDCPQGTFQGAGVKTVVLFFERGAPTRDISFYQLDPGRSGDDPGPLGDPTEPAEKLFIRLADGKARSIHYSAATTYWGPDGKPMSAQQFLERLFGDLTGLIVDEDPLRAEWSDPDRREKLIAVLADRGDADKLDACAG